MNADQDREIRAGFGRITIGVAVISTLDDKRPHGCTGMAWAEHATPPLLLTTLRAGGRTRALVEATGLFGVNVLGEQQPELVTAFAARSAEPGDRFSKVPYASGPVCGVPLLDGCVASFECEVEGVYPFGGHDIVVGRVRWAATGEGSPLAHYDGRLCGLREAGK